MLPQSQPQAPQVAPAIHIFKSSKFTRCSKKRTLLQWLRANEAPRPDFLTVASVDDAKLQNFKARFESFVEELVGQIHGQDTGYLCVDKDLNISRAIVEGSFPKSTLVDRRHLIENACLPNLFENPPSRGITCMAAVCQKGAEATNKLNMYVYLHPSIAWSTKVMHAMAGNLRTVGVRNEAGVLEESIIMQVTEITLKSNITASMFFHRIMCGNLYSDPHGAVENEDSDSDLDSDGRRSQAPSPEPIAGPSQAGPSGAGGSRLTPTAKRRASGGLHEASELNYGTAARVKMEPSPLGEEYTATPMATPMAVVFDFDVQNSTPAQTEAAMRSMARKISILQAELEEAKTAKEQAEEKLEEAMEMLEEEKAARRAETEAFKVALKALLR